MEKFSRSGNGPVRGAGRLPAKAQRHKPLAAFFLEQNQREKTLNIGADVETSKG